MHQGMRDKLYSILSRDSAITLKQIEQADRARRCAEAAGKWKEKAANVLEPSLDELLKTLTDYGWQAQVVTLPNGFAVNLNKGNMRVYQTSVPPFVRFTLANASTSVLVHTGTPSKSGEGSRDAECDVDSVTAEFVQEHVVRLVDELAKK